MATTTTTEVIYELETIAPVDLELDLTKPVDKVHLCTPEGQPIDPALSISSRPQSEGPTVENGEASEQYPVGSRFWTITLTMCIVLMLGGLDANIVATAVPRITDHFHTTADVGWYSAAYKLCLCAFQFMFGKLYKIFSIKRIFLLATVIFMLGSVLSAVAVSSFMFVLGRAVTGLGSAGVNSGCFTIVTIILPLRRRPFFVSVLAGLESIAVVVAPLLGGVLTETLGWRWCFYINLPIGAVALITTMIFLPPLGQADNTQMTFKQKMYQLDLLGNVLFVPGLTSLFLALSWAGLKYSWDSPTIIGLLVTFVALLAGFIWDQRRRGDAAAIPTRIFTRRSVLAGFIFSLCTNSVMNVFDYYLPTYFQAVREYSPSKSGVMLLPIIIGFAIGVLMHGAGTSMFGYYTPFMLFASTVMPISAGLMTTWKVNTSFAQLILYSGFTGFAGGIGFQGPQCAVQTVLHDSDMSLGISVILFAQNFGPALFVVLAQTIFLNQLATNVSSLAPGLNARTIENMGLTEIRNSIPMDKRAGFLVGLDKSLTQTWYMVVGLTCVTMIGSLTMEWGSVKHKKA